MLYHAVLGHDLTETYSNKRLKWLEIRFSQERVTSVCKLYGFIPGHAIDIKNGLGFDLAAGRKKAWDSILRDKLKLVN